MQQDLFNMMPPVQSSPARKYWKVWSEIPQIKVVVGLFMFAVVLLGLIKSMMGGTNPPLLMPLIGALTSAIAILVIDFKQRFGSTYMRLGFHMGMLVFLTAMPIISPELIGSFDERDRFTAGINLVLCIIGFELGYWLVRTFAGAAKPTAPFQLTGFAYKWLSRFQLIGLTSYAVYLAYALASSGRSLFTLLFVLRETLTVNPNEVMIVPDDTLNTLATLLRQGLYMAAASSCILLLSHNPRHFPINKTLCWFALALCAFTGMTSGSGGSRGNFMLAAVPLLATLWLYSGTTRTLRQLRPMFVMIILFFVYFGFQYLSMFRGKATGEGANFAEVDLTNTQLFSAFGIYSDYEKIVSGFPEKAPFQNGASLVPIALGWVPRRIWADKPYPFTSVANKILGLEVTTVSIASGLPGEGYGNFGIAGGFLWGILMGLPCAFVDYRLSLVRSGHPLRLAMCGILGVWAAIIVRGGTAEMFYMGLFPVSFMWVCLYFSQPKQMVARA